MEGVSNTTTVFTDRPYRRARVIPTAEFDGGFSETFDDGRGMPNGVLTGLVEGAEVPTRIVVEQNSADLDEAAHRLVYAVVQSDEQREAGAVATGVVMEACSLFIDKYASTSMHVHEGDISASSSSGLCSSLEGITELRGNLTIDGMCAV